MHEAINTKSDQGQKLQQAFHVAEVSNDRQPLPVQAKLTVSAPDDAFEREADSMADLVMRMPAENFVQRKCAHCEQEERELHRKPLSENITPFIQAKGNANTTAPDTVSQEIQQHRGRGSKMDNDTRGFMSQRFGADFSGVNIHTGSSSEQLNRQLQAKAFTVGNDIFFNSGQYKPQSGEGRQLLAHELTHVIQQNGFRTAIQRTPATMPAITGTSTPATDADVRESVQMAITYLTSANEFFQLATVDAGRLEAVLSGWITMANTYPSLIETRLNSDPALTQSFRQAFNNAVRTLFTRFASNAANNTTVQKLYLSNLHRLPVWSWPDVASFNLADDAQRRAFITNYTNALTDPSLFQGFTAMTIPQLESVLTYLFTLTTDTQNILANNLANDAALTTQLRTAYRDAINSLLSRAAQNNSPETVFSLFMRYRYSQSKIHEWADQDLSGFTVAVPQGLSQDPISPDITTSYNGIQIILQPDGTKSGTGAETTANMQFGSIHFEHTNGRITSFTSPSPSVTIQTSYASGSTAGSTSGYGRGTTAEDRRLSNTSLGYHERSHSRDYLRYIATHPAPAFTGSVGMTVQAFNAAITAWQTAMRAYSRDMNRQSELATDCVGNPNIVEFHHQQGTTTTVTCP